VSSCTRVGSCHGTTFSAAVADIRLGNRIPPATRSWSRAIRSRSRGSRLESGLRRRQEVDRFLYRGCRGSRRGARHDAGRRRRGIRGGV